MKIQNITLLTLGIIFLLGGFGFARVLFKAADTIAGEVKRADIYSPQWEPVNPFREMQEAETKGIITRLRFAGYYCYVIGGGGLALLLIYINIIVSNRRLRLGQNEEQMVR